MIPVSNPRANYRAHEAEIRRAILHVLDNNHYVGGDQVRLFEKEFASFVEVKHAIAVGSGTDALIIAMMALGIGPHHSVALPTNTAVATAAAIADTGATPVFIDVNDDGLMNTKNIPDHVAAIIPVHLYGQSLNYDDFPNEPRVIEDCAQACGAWHDGPPGIRLGYIGDLGCFSFYPTKNLGAIGDGGMIVTSDAVLAKQCRYIREYGWNSARIPQRKGFNSRLDSIQAAILRVKLKYLDAENAERRGRALCYNDGLGDLVETPSDQSVFHQYVIKCDKRDELMAHLKARGIQTAIHYPVPIHKQPVYGCKIRLPNAERLARRILSLPMYPELTVGEVEQVIYGIRSFYCSL